MKKSILAMVMLGSSMLVGCASSLQYNPKYVGGAGTGANIEGKATLVMSDEAQKMVFTGGPSSLTGAATSITLPMGQISREAGLVVLGGSFKDGVQVAVANTDGTYNLDVQVRNFSYKYDQLSNLGMAVTPKVSVEMVAKVYDAQGKEIVDKTYSRTDFKGDTYMISTQPAEIVNENFHRAVSDMFRELVKDINDKTSNKSS